MKNKQLQIRCTEEQKELIEKLAKLENRSLSNYILNLVEKESEKLKVIDSMESFEIRADGGIDVVEKKIEKFDCTLMCGATVRSTRRTCCIFCKYHSTCKSACEVNIKEVEYCSFRKKQE